jgi:hypothetical protein
MEYMMLDEVQVRATQAKFDVERNDLQLKKRREFIESTIVEISVSSMTLVTASAGLGKATADRAWDPDNKTYGNWYEPSISSEDTVYSIVKPECGRILVDHFRIYPVNMKYSDLGQITFYGSEKEVDDPEDESWVPLCSILNPNELLEDGPGSWLSLDAQKQRSRRGAEMVEDKSVSLKSDTELGFARLMHKRPVAGSVGNGDIGAIEVHGAAPWINPDDDGDEVVSLKTFEFTLAQSKKELEEWEERLHEALASPEGRIQYRDPNAMRAELELTDSQQRGFDFVNMIQGLVHDPVRCISPPAPPPAFASC